MWVTCPIISIQITCKGGVELNDLTTSNGTENEVLMLNNTDLVVSRILDNVAFTGSHLTFNSTTNELSLTNSSQNIDLSVLSFWSRNAANNKLFPKNIGDNVGIGTNNPQTSLDVVGTTTITNQTDGAVLLNLNTERNWQFKQLGTGASTSLELTSVGVVVIKIL